MPKAKRQPPVKTSGKARTYISDNYGVELKEHSGLQEVRVGHVWYNLLTNNGSVHTVTKKLMECCGNSSHTQVLRQHVDRLHKSYQRLTGSLATGERFLDFKKECHKTLQVNNSDLRVLSIDSTSCSEVEPMPVCESSIEDAVSSVIDPLSTPEVAPMESEPPCESSINEVAEERLPSTMVLSHSGVQTRNFNSAATIAALRSQVAHYKGRVARLMREKKRLRRLLKERLVKKLKETVNRRDAKIRKLNTKLTPELLKFLRNKQRREKYMKNKFADRVTEYKAREKAMKQQLQQSEKNVLELTQEMSAMQNGPPGPVLREGKSKQ